MKKSDAEDTEGVMGFEPAEHISTHHHMAIPWQDFFTNDNQIKVLYIGQDSVDQEVECSILNEVDKEIKVN